VPDMRDFYREELNALVVLSALGQSHIIGKERVTRKEELTILIMT
jgi:hypothetical protein